MPKAKEAAQIALSLDGNLSEAHATLGLILTNYDYDFAAAEREYKRAIELNPTYATAHFYYGQLLSQFGRHEEAFTSYRRALELEPFSLIINVFYGSSMLNARRYDEAIAQLKKTLELDPNFAIAHSTLSGIYQAKGNYAESVEEFAKFQELVGNSQVAVAGRDIFARGGWHVFLQKMSAEEQIYRNDGRYRIIFLTALGEKDKAIEALNNEYEKRRYFITLLKVSPLLDPLRDDPSFQELLRRVGFPE
jgi:tetratricopeptide (TPR) repeat protein